MASLKGRDPCVVKAVRVRAPITVKLACASLLAACSGDDIILSTGATSTSGGTGSTSNAVTTSGSSTSTSTSTSTSSGTTSMTSGSTTHETGPESTTRAPECPEGMTVCVDGIAKTCDGRGGYSAQEVCEVACWAGSCVPCVPGELLCTDEGDSAVCAVNGKTWHVLQECDPVQGLICDGGVCQGACQINGRANVGGEGCEFYPTVTANRVADAFSFAVAINNRGDSPANIQIDRGDETVALAVVGAKDAEVVALPWVAELKSSAGASSVRVTGGAYRLRSDQPVSVVQFSSIDYVNGDATSRSNDATLLQPTIAWYDSFVVASYNTWRSADAIYYPGFYAITAAENGTTIELIPSASGGDVRPGGGVAADGTGTITLDRGDVLQVLSAGSGPNPIAADLTGTRITSDKPVQLIGGHMCASIPDGAPECDHLEAMIEGSNILGAVSYVTAPLDHLGLATRPQKIRITARFDDTKLIYHPEPPGAPATIAKSGDYVELDAVDTDLIIIGNRPVLISQYLLGQGVLGGPGDPSMSMDHGGNVLDAGPRSFYVPPGFPTSFVNILRCYGEGQVLLDGELVEGFVEISEGWGCRVARAPVSGGVHTVEGIDDTVAISVYGYGEFASYRYSSPHGVEIIPW
jgi:hypothetical protein